MTLSCSRVRRSGVEREPELVVLDEDGLEPREVVESRHDLVGEVVVGEVEADQVLEREEELRDFAGEEVALEVEVPQPGAELQIQGQRAGERVEAEAEVAARLPRTSAGILPENTTPGRRSTVTRPFSQRTPAQLQGVGWVTFQRRVRPPTEDLRASKAARSELRSGVARGRRSQEEQNEKPLGLHF